MKTLSLFILLGFSALWCRAQSVHFSREEFARQYEESRKNIVSYIQEPPQYKGGVDSLHTYLVANLKYPSKALRKNREGKVYVYFVVDRTDGHIRDARILKSTDSVFDEEALRVVLAMPNWIPGKQDGRSVNTSHNIPIIFTLEPVKK
ncbi:energy transducer TonB [Mucilaginibacter terrae]|nr:energy transducer TonB [Mucilaginibacter terrae]